MRHRRDSRMEHSRRGNSNHRHGDHSRNAESQGNKGFRERRNPDKYAKPNINNNWDQHEKLAQDINWDQNIKPDQNNNWDQHVKPDQSNNWDQNVKPDKNNNWDQHVKQDHKNNWDRNVKPYQNNNCDQHVKLDQKNNWDRHVKLDQKNNWDQHVKPDQNNNWDQHVKLDQKNNWDQHVKPDQNNNWDQHVKLDQKNNWDQHVKPDQNNNWDQHVKLDQKNNWDRHVKLDQNNNWDRNVKPKKESGFRDVAGSKHFMTNERRPVHMFGNNDKSHEPRPSSDVAGTGPHPTLQRDIGSSGGSKLPSFASTFFRSTPWKNGPQISAVYSLPPTEWMPGNNVGNSKGLAAEFGDAHSPEMCLPDLIPPQLPFNQGFANSLQGTSKVVEPWQIDHQPPCIPFNNRATNKSIGSSECMPSAETAKSLQTPNQPSSSSDQNCNPSSCGPLDVIHIPLPLPPPPPPPQTPDQVVSTNTPATTSNSKPSNRSGHSMNPNKERAELRNKNVTYLNGHSMTVSSNGPISSAVYTTSLENDRFKKMEGELHHESDKTSRGNMLLGSNWFDFQNNSHVNSSRRHNVRNYECPHLRSANYERPYLRSTISSTGVHNSRNFDKYEDSLANQQEFMERNRSYCKTDLQDTCGATEFSQAFHAIPLFPNIDTPDEAFHSTGRNDYNGRRQQANETQNSGYQVPPLLFENGARYTERHQPFGSSNSRKRTFEGKFRNPNTSSCDDSHFKRDARHHEVDPDRSRRSLRSPPHDSSPHNSRPCNDRSNIRSTARYIPNGGTHLKDGPYRPGPRNGEDPNGRHRSEHPLNRTNSRRNNESAGEKSNIRNNWSDCHTNISAPTTKYFAQRGEVYPHPSKVPNKPSGHTGAISKGKSQVDKNIVASSLPKAEQPGQSHAKAEQPRQCHPEAEQPRQSHLKDEQPRQSHLKAEQPRQSHPKAEQPRHSNPKAEQSRQSHPKAEQPRQSHPKAEQPRQSHPKAEQPRYSSSKSEQTRLNYPKSEQPEPSNLKAEQTVQPQHGADKPTEKVSDPFHKRRQDRYNSGRPFTDVIPVKSEARKHEYNRHWKKVRFATEICAATSSTDKVGNKSESKVKSSAITADIPSILSIKLEMNKPLEAEPKSTPSVKLEMKKPYDTEPTSMPSVKMEMNKPSATEPKVTPLAQTEELTSSVKLEIMKPSDPESKIDKSNTGLAKIVTPEIHLDNKTCKPIVKLEQDIPIRSISCFTIPRIKSIATSVEGSTKADKKSSQKKTVRVSPLMIEDQNKDDYEMKTSEQTKSSTPKKEASSKGKKANLSPKLNVLTTGQRKMKAKQVSSPAKLPPKLRHKTKNSSEKSTSNLLDKLVKDKSDNVEMSFEDKTKQAECLSQNEMLNTLLNEPTVDLFTEDEGARLSQLPCVVTRGKFVMPTPSTYKVKDLNKQTGRRSTSEFYGEPGGEVGEDTFNKAMFSAKKHLLYRAMAVQALSRDKTKPVLVKKKGVRTSSITIDMAEKEISKCTDAVLTEMGLVNKVKPNLDRSTKHTDEKNTTNNTGNFSDKNEKATKVTKSLAELDTPTLITSLLENLLFKWEKQYF